MINQSQRSWILVLLVLGFGLLYLVSFRPSEPFYYNDETRHVMTGVYFRDLLQDRPFLNLREYTINYYLQYPSLGLLVWPPLFHVLEGLAMSVFGTSIVVSKVLIGLFTALACVYLFRLVRLSHDFTRATITVLFFAISPLVFELSHYVMLELPAVALALAAIYHFVAFLETDRRTDLFAAALFSALAALTRYDAAHLVFLFLILIAVQKRWRILWRRDVLVSAAVALIVIAPFYALAASQVGWLHFKSATETLDSNPSFLSLNRLIYYFSILPGQVGFILLIAAVIGLIFGLSRGQRKTSWPYLAILVVTYITFTPIGELDERHTIYWIPAIAFFAAGGIGEISERLSVPQIYLPLATCTLIGTVWMSKDLWAVRGYEEAAREVAAKSTGRPFCLFVGRLNGNFIYQLRRSDPNRRLWVLRADKVLFSVLTVPGIPYKPLAASDDETLAPILKYDPEFIVVEEPGPLTTADIDQAELLRREFEKDLRDVISNHPERFGLEKVIAVNSNDPYYQGMTLRVFKHLLRSNQPSRQLEFDILMLRRSFQTVVPD